MVRLCVRARSHAGEPPSGGSSCVKTMRPRSSSVRSQRLFKASSACSWHASVQGGSWDRRSRVVVSSSCVSPLSCSWIVAGAGRWLFQASELCGPWHGTGAKGGGAAGSSPFGRSGLPLPQSFPPRAWCSTGAAGSRERGAPLGLGSPTSPACAVSPSWRLLPRRSFPSAGCSSRTVGRRRAACASSSSTRPCRSWPRPAPRPGPCPAAWSSSP